MTERKRTLDDILKEIIQGLNETNTNFKQFIDNQNEINDAVIKSLKSLQLQIHDLEKSFLNRGAPF